MTSTSSPGASTPGAAPAATTGVEHVCVVCSYVYDPAVGDPDHGIPPGTAFADLPDNYECPECGVGKHDFEVLAF